MVATCCSDIDLCSILPRFEVAQSAAKTFYLLDQTPLAGLSKTQPLIAFQASYLSCQLFLD